MSKNSVVVDIDAFLNPGFSGAFKSADEKMGTLKGSIGDLERQARQMSAFKEIKSTARESVFAIKGYKNELQALQTEMAAQEKAGKKATREQKKQLREIQKNLGATTKQYDKNRQKLHGLREELGKAGIDTNRLSSEQEKLARDLNKSGLAYQGLAKSQKLSQTSSRYREQRNQAGSEAMGAFAPVIAGGMAMISPLRYEHEMARAYSPTGANDQQKSQLDEAAKYVADNYATTSHQAALTEGVYGQSGFKAEEIVGMLPSTFDIVEATREDPDLVANLIGNSKTAFDLDANAKTMPDGSLGMSDDMLFLSRAC
jgi:myosin heavy subunit